MKIVAIIQARMGSTRLPGKVLMDLSGQSVLARVVRRVQRSKTIDDVVVATTTSPADDRIVGEVTRLGVFCLRGSEDDVLDRYRNACILHQANVVVRITSDCPLIDPELLDQTVHAFLEARADYASNDRPPTYPRGLDTEVFTADALERAWRDANLNYQREHVTPYLYEHPEIFRLASLNNPVDYSRHRWTLDTPEDLELIRALYDHFGGRDDSSWRQILELVEREAALPAINAHVRQKQLQEG